MTKEKASRKLREESAVFYDKGSYPPRDSVYAVSGELPLPTFSDNVIPERPPPFDKDAPRANRFVLINSY